MISKGTNHNAKQNVIRDQITRYMWFPGIRYTKFSFISKSDLIIFIQRRVKAWLYIYSLQLISIGTNPQAKQNVFIRDVKTRYMLWPGIKYPKHSFISKSDWIIYLPRLVKVRLYTYSSQLSLIGTIPHEKNFVFHDLKTRYMLWPGMKYIMYLFISKSTVIILIPQRVKLGIYTGCFTTLGHNCRRWFPRSLWSKKFI
jgi:hypothetical protein